MAIDLSILETGARYAGEYEGDLLALQKRIGRLQRAAAAHRRRVLVVLEGLAGAELGGIANRLAARCDLAGVRVRRVLPPTPEEATDQFLRRFWAMLPRAGEFVVLERSWYGRVLLDRVEGLVTERTWRRAYDEINEFEAQLTSDGIVLVKLWVHVTAPTASARLKARLADPWARALLPASSLREHERRAEYEPAVAELLASTDTRWAPWAALDGNNRKGARIAALTAVADRLAQSLPANPPEAGDAVRRAAAAMGLVLDEAPPVA